MRKALNHGFDEMIARIDTPKDRAARARFFKTSAVKPCGTLTKLKRSGARTRANGRGVPRSS